jgi:bleomycin hydrolase
MNKSFLIFYVFLFHFSFGCGQADTQAKIASQATPYTFTTISEVKALPVINQHASGTCWAFSTTSFLESEIIRIKGESIDLSEMYFVRNAYIFKTRNYVMRQGTARFTEGGCNHDPLITLSEFGLMPQAVYTGHVNNDTIYDHRNLIKKLEPKVKSYANPENKLGTGWKTEVPAILDDFIGKTSDTFSYAGNHYTPLSFLTYARLNPDDYINITSFTHAPFYKPFVLNIPANWTNEKYYNVSLEEYIANIDHALDAGYSLTIDLDMSEPGFSINRGIAYVAPNTTVTPESRQSDFENFITTDDHNMHLVGKVKDQHGDVYYKCKNSWGPSLGIGGFFYLSASYVKMKSISVLLHKDGLMEATRRKLGL